MAEEFIIDQLKIELAGNFDASKQQEIQEVTLQILDRLNAKYFDGLDFEIEEISLDLGSLPINYFEEEYAIRLSFLLENEIKKFLHENHASIQYQSSFGLIDAIKQYLTFGFSLSNEKSLHDLFAQGIVKDYQLLYRAISEISAQTIVKERLLNQLDFELAEVLWQLNYPDYIAIKRLNATVRSLNGFSNEMPSVIQAFLKEATIAFMLAPHPKNKSLKSYFRFLEQQIAATNRLKKGEKTKVYGLLIGIETGSISNNKNYDLPLLFDAISLFVLDNKRVQNVDFETMINASRELTIAQIRALAAQLGTKLFRGLVAKNLQRLHLILPSKFLLVFYGSLPDQQNGTYKKKINNILLISSFSPAISGFYLQGINPDLITDYLSGKASLEHIFQVFSLKSGRSVISLIDHFEDRIDHNQREKHKNLFNELNELRSTLEDDHRSFAINKSLFGQLIEFLELGIWNNVEFSPQEVFSKIQESQWSELIQEFKKYFERPIFWTRFVYQFKVDQVEAMARAVFYEDADLKSLDAILRQLGDSEYQVAQKRRVLEAFVRLKFAGLNQVDFKFNLAFEQTISDILFQDAGTTTFDLLLSALLDGSKSAEDLSQKELVSLQGSENEVFRFLFSNEAKSTNWKKVLNLLRSEPLGKILSSLYEVYYFKHSELISRVFHHKQFLKELSEDELIAAIELTVKGEHLALSKFIQKVFERLEKKEVRTTAALQLEFETAMDVVQESDESDENELFTLLDNVLERESLKVLKDHYSQDEFEHVIINAFHLFQTQTRSIFRKHGVLKAIGLLNVFSKKSLKLLLRKTTEALGDDLQDLIFRLKSSNSNHLTIIDLHVMAFALTADVYSQRHLLEYITLALKSIALPLHQLENEQEIEAQMQIDLLLDYLETGHLYNQLQKADFMQYAWQATSENGAMLKLSIVNRNQPAVLMGSFLQLFSENQLPIIFSGLCQIEAGKVQSVLKEIGPTSGNRKISSLLGLWFQLIENDPANANLKSKVDHIVALLAESMKRTTNFQLVMTDNQTKSGNDFRAIVDDQNEINLITFVLQKRQLPTWPEAKISQLAEQIFDVKRSVDSKNSILEKYRKPQLESLFSKIADVEIGVVKAVVKRLTNELSPFNLIAALSAWYEIITSNKTSSSVRQDEEHIALLVAKMLKGEPIAQSDVLFASSENETERLAYHELNIKDLPLELTHLGVLSRLQSEHNILDLIEYVLLNAKLPYWSDLEAADHFLNDLFIIGNYIPLRLKALFERVLQNQKLRINCIKFFGVEHSILLFTRLKISNFEKFQSAFAQFDELNRKISTYSFRLQFYLPRYIAITSGVSMPDFATVNGLIMHDFQEYLGFTESEYQIRLNPTLSATVLKYAALNKRSQQQDFGFNRAFDLLVHFSVEGDFPWWNLPVSSQQNVENTATTVISELLDLDSSKLINKVGSSPYRAKIIEFWAGQLTRSQFDRITIALSPNLGGFIISFNLLVEKIDGDFMDRTWIANLLTSLFKKEVSTNWVIEKGSAFWASKTNTSLADFRENLLEKATEYSNNGELRFSPFVTLLSAKTQMQTAVNSKSEFSDFAEAAIAYLASKKYYKERITLADLLKLGKDLSRSKIDEKQRIELSRKVALPSIKSRLFTSEPIILSKLLIETAYSESGSKLVESKSLAVNFIMQFNSEALESALEKAYYQFLFTEIKESSAKAWETVVAAFVSEQLNNFEIEEQHFSEISSVFIQSKKLKTELKRSLKFSSKKDRAIISTNDQNGVSLLNAVIFYIETGLIHPSVSSHIRNEVGLVLAISKSIERASYASFKLELEKVFANEDFLKKAMTRIPALVSFLKMKLIISSPADDSNSNDFRTKLDQEIDDVIQLETESENKLIMPFYSQNSYFVHYIKTGTLPTDYRNVFNSKTDFILSFEKHVMLSKPALSQEIKKALQEEAVRMRIVRTEDEYFLQLVLKALDLSAAKVLVKARNSVITFWNEYAIEVSEAAQLELFYSHSIEVLSLSKEVPKASKLVMGMIAKSLNMFQFNEIYKEQELEHFGFSFEQKELIFKKLAKGFTPSIEKEKQPSEKELVAKVKPFNKPVKRKAEENKDLIPDITLDMQVNIFNAGLVILWPYIAQLFKMLNLTDKNEFISPEAEIKAVHILQYAATGLDEAEEHHLLLNKVLCGVKLATPIPLEMELTENEKSITNQMLKGVLQNWNRLSNTSIEAMRETFLMREGMLDEIEKNFQLKVEKKTLDILLESMPWSFGMIKLPWMNKRLLVEWI